MTPDSSWRSEVLNGLFRLLAVTGVLGLLVTTPVLFADGQVLLAIGYWLALAPFLVLAFRPSLGVPLRLFGLLATCFAVALGIALGERRVPELGVYLVALPVIAALVGGKRWGLATLAACGVTIGGVAASYVGGWLGTAPPRSDDDTYLGNWVTFGANWALFAATLSVATWYVVQRLEAALERSLVLAERLRSEVRRGDEAETGRALANAALLHSQKLEVVGRVSGGAAHDFNNVLTAINFAAEEAVAASSEASRRERLELVRDASDHAARLTKQLLAFSRQDVMQARLVDVDELLADTGRLFARVVASDVDLRVERAGVPLVARVDPVQLQQVLLNLVLNAKDATPNGGRLDVRAEAFRGVPDVREGSPPLPDGAWIVLRVRDDGTGMTPDTAERIFEPFFTTKPAGIGTGLGLYTAADIVERAGGGIGLQTAPGRGTVFAVYLPWLEHALAAASPGRDSGVRGGTGERILVVDDDLAVRAVLCRALDGAGYEVADAGSGPAALRLLDEEGVGAPDLLLTDVVMPGLRGTELAEAVRERRPDVAVVYCSGYVPDEALARAVADGEATLLAKPFDRAALLAAVRDALAEGGVRAEGVRA